MPSWPRAVSAASEVGAREQHPDAFLDAPGGADLAGGVIVSEDAVEAVHGTFGQPVPGTEEQKAVGPGQVVLAAPMALGLLRDALADLGDHQVREPHQVPVVDPDPRRGEGGIEGGPERRGGVDRDDLDPVRPGRGAGVEPALDAGAVAAVHDAEDLPGVGVDERAHPRLDQLPATGVVAEEPGTSEPVLIHPRMPYPQGVDLGQLDHRGIDRVLHGPPRHPVAGRDFVHGAARVQHRIGQVFPQPGQAPRPGRELLGGLGERLPPASVLGAHHAGLPDHHFDHITAGRDVTDPLLHPRHAPGSRSPRNPGIPVPLDHLHRHTPATQRQVDRIDDVVSGQVEDNARSITPRARRLVQGSCPSEVGCLTHPSAWPRAALRYDTTTLNCEEPQNPQTRDLKSLRT